MSKSTDPKNNLSVSWSSPSNIALVKYWGKHGRQLPRNASVSFTLNQAKTITRISASDMPKDASTQIQFTFEGKENPTFARRTEQFFDAVKDAYFPLLKHKLLTIDTENTFPHSSGIASSASGMSALALGLCDLEQQLSGVSTYDDAFFKKASMIARLGSGSAARSVYPHLCVWGKHERVPNSSDEYGIDVSAELHPIFRDFHDDILIVSDEEKRVSSSAGHGLMDNNPFASVRYQQAATNLTQIMQALREGDLATFGKITEDEALTLHALMMCSDPSFILMAPQSLEVIQKIRHFRQNTGIPVYFTLDAGPNVHVLYPHAHAPAVRQFIDESLAGFCKNRYILQDQVGKGPEKLL